MYQTAGFNRFPSIYAQAHRVAGIYVPLRFSGSIMAPECWGAEEHPILRALLSSAPMAQNKRSFLVRGRRAGGPQPFFQKGTACLKLVSNRSGFGGFFGCG
jgi:hypothetical protein